MRHTESRLQVNCVSWFRLAHRPLSSLLFSVPNGACVSASQGRILKAEGMTAGVSDLILLVPNSQYHALAIEMKQDKVEWRLGKETHTKTYQRPEQREWQAAVEAQGYRYEVVRTETEFKTLIEAYLNEKD